MNSAGTIAIQPQRLKQLLKRMMDIYSPSGKEEDVLDYLHAYLKRHGINVLRQFLDGRRCNLVVLPPGGHIHMAFIGHVDTVTAYDLDDFAFQEEGDEIRGLGAADMKSGCAAMVEAYLALRETGRCPAAALVLVVGEEEDGDGIQRLLKEHHFPWVLIGEPTGLKPCLSHYGYLEIQLVTTGTRKHASLADPAMNAIEAMLPLLLKLSRYWENQRPEAIYNIRELSSSRGGFVIPDRCEAWLDVHFPPDAPVGEITLEVEEALAGGDRSSSQSTTTLRFPTIHSGYSIPDRGSTVDMVKEVYSRHDLDWRPESFRSHSDANLLWMAGAKPILMGPGLLEKAHVADESVPFSEVCLAAQIYADIMASLSF